MSDEARINVTGFVTIPKGTDEEEVGNIVREIVEDGELSIDSTEVVECLECGQILPADSDGEKCGECEGLQHEQ